MNAAVLCTIPITEDAWYEREKEPLVGDYVRFITQTRFEGRPAWPYFRSEAAVIAANLEKIGRLGVAVTLNATTSDLRQAASKYAHIILVGHRKGMVLPGDSLQNRTDFAAGKRLELWDAMLDGDMLCDLYPDRFAGSTVWVVCHSSVPAERFRRRYPDARVFSSDPEVLLGACVVKLYATLRFMQTHGVPMWQAILAAGEMIDQIAGESRS